MAGCVGDDDFGRQLLGNLRAEQIDVGDVRVTPGVPTGLAMISVDQAGENIITVSPGANHETGEQEVAAAAGTTQAGVLVICAEIPIPAIRAALARVGRPLCVLNLAPAPDEAAAIVADGVDWLVVNETEAAAILGHDVDGLAGAARAAQALVTAGARHAVVTAGAHGAAYAGDGAEPVAIEPSPVEAVDSVGAGDAFVGALAVALAAGVPAAEAVRAASAAGATAATRAGAQAGMPRPDDISGTTGVRWPVT
jgi:ribokinase